MEHVFKKFLAVTALLGAVAIQADETIPSLVTYINGRPVSFNAARKVSGEVGKVHKYDELLRYSNFSVTPGYERSFRGGKLAQCLFGDLLTTSSLQCNDECLALLVQGSDIPNRDSNAILADYFYLPTDYNSTLSFNPQISNFFIDLNFYLGLDEWWKGGYFRVYAPFVHTHRTLHMRENIINAGTNNSLAGYFTPGDLPRTDLLANATAFLSGDSLPNQQGIALYGLCYSKMEGQVDCNKPCDNTGRTRNGFGDIRAELGWNFWQHENGHFGFNIQAAAPTGNRPKAEFLFDTVIGNGKHWELGAGATGHYTFWRGLDETRHASINMDLSVLHLFGARQQRIFDLANKPLSRYMLAAQFRPTVSNEDTLFGKVTVNAELESAADFIFNNVYTPIANLTTQEVKVSVGAQLDLAVWLNFTAGGFSTDFGYDLWYSGCEKFNCPNSKCPSLCCPVTFAQNSWAIKGNAEMFGANIVDNVLTPTTLSSSVSEATITNGAAQNADFDPFNATIDNPQLAFDADGQLFDATNGDIEINTSIQPKFITSSDLTAAVQAAARTRQISNKVWAHLQYTWDREGWIPYLGAGASGEFGGRRSNDECNPTTNTADCNKDCNNCIRCTPSQWAIWVKTGFQF